MRKVALVLSLIALTLNSCGKQDSHPRPKSYQSVSLTESDNSSKNSQIENSLVQLHNAGMTQMKFGSLKMILGNIDIANYAIENNTHIVLFGLSNENVNGQGYNKMIDDFNMLHTSNNEALIQNYQLYADENCTKIYGCVGSDNGSDHNWKIMKFLPSPEKCSFEPTITLSNVMLHK